MNTNDKVKWVFSSENNQQLSDRYDVWAKDYEQDLADMFGYISPERSMRVLVKYVPTTAKILDVGCGTGLVGKLLHQQGYDNLEGMDLSTGMLVEARKTNVYNKFHHQALGTPLNIQSDAFDALISVGVFTYGHAPSSAFDELVRVTKSGGHIIFTLPNDLYENGDFKNKLTSLEKTDQLTLVEKGEAFRAHQKSDHDHLFRVWVYTVN